MGRIMKITVHVEGNLRSWADNLQKQIRYAAAVTLTRTAQTVAKAEEAEVGVVFDSPTPFTRKAFMVGRATKENLTATVSIRPRQAAYLRAQIEGGRRSQKAFERKLAGETNANGYWVPGQGVNLNAHGNLSATAIQKIASRLKKSGQYADVFVGVPRGHAGAPLGIWARPKRGKDKGTIKPLLVRIAAPGYRKRFEFYGVAQSTVGKTWQTEFDKALAQALATMR